MKHTSGHTGTPSLSLIPRQPSLCFEGFTHWSIIKSTNVLMPPWWLQPPPPHMHTGCGYLPYLTAYMYASTVTVANQSSSLSRTGSRLWTQKTINTMSTCTIWAYVCQLNVIITDRSTKLARPKAAMIWRACSRNFTRVAVYLFVQMELSRWKVVCSGQLTPGLSLADNGRQGAWAQHAAVTRQQSLKAKI